MNSGLTAKDVERYKRQLMLEGFTARHQQRLKDSSALVAGVGGLGGTAALYLAVAGIGRMVLVHAGNLTLSNMNRQILMKDSNIGKQRVDQARQTIREINPAVDIEVFDERFTEINAEKLLGTVRIALSARPNFHERRVLNMACVENGTPLVEAAMNGMEGYLLNVVPGVTSCMHCVYPEVDPSWEELGFPVLGAVSGMLGCMMAIEAIKLLTGYGKPLASEMMIFDALDMEFRKVKIPRNETCEVCGRVAPQRR